MWPVQQSSAPPIMTHANMQYGPSHIYLHLLGYISYSWFTAAVKLPGHGTKCQRDLNHLRLEPSDPPRRPAAPPPRRSRPAAFPAERSRFVLPLSSLWARCVEGNWHPMANQHPHCLLDSWPGFGEPHRRPYSTSCDIFPSLTRAGLTQMMWRSARFKKDMQHAERFSRI